MKLSIYIRLILRLRIRGDVPPVPLYLYKTCILYLLQDQVSLFTQLVTYVLSTCQMQEKVTHYVRQLPHLARATCLCRPVISRASPGVDH